LTKYAKHVHLLVRGPRLRASAAMAQRVAASGKVTVHYRHSPVDVYGDVKGRLTGVRLRNEETGVVRDLPCRGVFYAVGHLPNSGILEGQVELDERGYVVVDHACQTSVPGVFAAGDLHDTEWRQAITAAGSGCSAAIAAERYLVANDLLVAATGAAHEATPATAAAALSTDAAAYDPSATKHAGQFALRRLYHESSRPLLVIYTSPTCGPCRRLKPMLASLVDDEQYAQMVRLPPIDLESRSRGSPQVHYVEIDIEKDPEIAEASGITGTPTVQVFHRKQRLNVLPGVRMKSEYRTVLDKALADSAVSAVG